MRKSIPANLSLLVLLTLPVSRWSPVVINVLGTGGNSTTTATNAVKRNVPKQFYILKKQ